MSRLLVFQNYYTPARDALFRELASTGIDLTVLYAHSPQDEGRNWVEPSDVPYTSEQLRYLTFAKNIVFWVPTRFWRRSGYVIVSDNNPTNLCMIVWTLVFRFFRCRICLWVEHIPDTFKSRAKYIFQKTCTCILSGLSHRILAFSEMTVLYLRQLGISDAVKRTVQATPRPIQRPARQIAQPLRNFGYLGSGDLRKNVSSLLSAFSSLPDQSLRLHIAGFLGECTDPRVVWHGYVSETSREAFFEAIDVLVLPSLADPWGFVTNEALDRGRLAIVSDRCGSSELITQVSDGLVCTTDPEGIFNAMSQVIGLDAGSIDALLKRAERAMMDHSIKRAAEQFVMAAGQLR